MPRHPCPLLAVAVLSGVLSLGACRPPCDLLETQCTVNGTKVCTDLSTDFYNCGACGTTCDPGLTCLSGACTVLCPNDLLTCQASGNGYCANPLTDSLNCGACGAACLNGEVCSAGSCAEECAPYLALCGTSCIDTTSSPGNCGGCDLACLSSEICENAICITPQPPCPDGGCPQGCLADQIPCTEFDEFGMSENVCVDPQFDSLNCGGCGEACPTGEACEMGACTCANGYTPCGLADGGAFCTNLVTDIDNCGTCGLVCPAGSYCNNACVTVDLARVSSPTVSGEVATLLGAGFASNAVVLFGRTPAGVVSAAPVELQVVVPPGVSGETTVTVSVNGALSNPVIAEVWGTHEPVNASGPYTSCTTAASNTGRKIAIDEAGTIYLAFQCGPAAAGADYVAVSSDYGHSFHQSALPIGGYLELGLQGGPAGTVFAAAFTPSNGLAYLFSTDYGTTWSAPVILDADLVAPAVVSLAYVGGVLQITASENMNIVLFSSNSPTSGAAFVKTNSSQLAVEYFDVLLDPSGNGYVAGDYSSVLIQPETNGGLDDVTVPTSPLASVFYSDWAVSTRAAGTVLYGGGLSSFPLAAPASAFAVFASDLTTAYPYTGMEVVDAPQTAAVTADLAGNGYLVAQSTGNIGVQQLPYGGTAGSNPVTVAEKGTWPVIAAGLGQSVIVGYTDSDGGVDVAVQTFP